MLAPSKKSYDQPRQCIKKQRHHIATRGPCSQSYGLSFSHIQMWELDHEEGWALNWFFWTVVLEKIFESPLICKEVKTVTPKRNQPWILIPRTDAEAPMLCPPDAKSWLIGKDPEAGKDWKEEKGPTEDEMVWWHHRLNEHQFEQTPVVCEGQGSSACCSPLVGKKSEMTKWLSNKWQHNQWYKTESFFSGV